METNFRLNEAVQVHLADNPNISVEDLLTYTQNKAKELGATTCPYELVEDLMACE